MPDPLYQTAGGFEAMSVWSGQVAPTVSYSGTGAFAVGSDVMFQSGPGRLHAVIPHQSVLSLSGVQANFYDGAAPVSGGPVPASGHIFLGALPGGAGVSGQLTAGGTPFVFVGGVPFASGLCYNSRSGQPGITVVWASEPLNAKRQ